MLKNIALIGLIALSGTVLAAKSGYYRWIDDQGQPHFSQKPPTDRPSTFVETKSGYSRNDSEPPYPPTVPPKRADSGTNTKGDSGEQKLEILPQRDPARCEQARTALESLSRGQRVRVKDESGEYRVLNNEEKAEQQNRAQEAIKIYC